VRSIKNITAILLLACSGGWAQSYVAGGTYPPATVAAGTGAPMWMRNFGTGASGDVTCSGTLASGAVEVDTVNFTVAVGTTCNVGTATRLATIIKATNKCTIAGTLTTASAVGITAQGDSGGAGGGGGGGTGAGTAGSNTTIAGNITVLAAGGSGGTAGGGTAGTPGTVPAALQQFLLSTGAILRGGSVGGNGGSSGPTGGLGAPNIILICRIMDFQATGVITANGFNGSNSTGNNVGPSAGGGGGVVAMAAQYYASAAGTINVAGGNPGTCLSFTGCGAATAGASGWSAILNIQ
jgi:hypothetical protein